MIPYTPGPWKMWIDNDVKVRSVAQHPKNIAKVFNDGDQDATFANARLIAAAPEMLALIQQLSRTTVGHGCVPLEGNDGKSGFIGDARAFLAKIEGKSEPTPRGWESV